MILLYNTDLNLKMPPAKQRSRSLGSATPRLTAGGGDAASAASAKKRRMKRRSELLTSPKAKRIKVSHASLCLDLDRVSKMFKIVTLSIVAWFKRNQSFHKQRHVSNLEELRSSL